MKQRPEKNKRCPRQPLGAVAYDQICRRIITLDYQPGAILDEKQLMADLDVGRTPVREALLRLAAEHWVEMQPNRGAVVPAITIQGTKAVFEAMKILEIGVAGLALGLNLDRQLAVMREAAEEVRQTIHTGDIVGLVEANHRFHVAYAGCAHNDFIMRSCIEVRNQAKRLAYLSYAHDVDREISLEGHYASVIDEHEAILGCLENKDAAGLEAIILQHIATFQQRIVNYMSA